MIDYQDESLEAVTHITGTSSLYINKEPHIHLHCITSDADLAELDIGLSELCCHGCGAAVNVVFDNATMEKYPYGAPTLGALKTNFVKQHANCVDLKDEFRKACPSRRTSTFSFDIRKL